MDDVCKVLLIEDSPTDARLFIETLADNAATVFDVTTVGRLADGLKLLDEQTNEIQIVVLDMNLPDSMGLETFERLSAAAGDLPIVIASGIEDEEFALHAVQAGAEDYLVKGHWDEFWLARSLLYAIERRRERLRRRAAERQLRVQDEQFRIARDIQQKLFPSRDPELQGFDISGASFPADETGGDYFDYLEMTDGYFGVVIGDVSGHGVGPALLMAETHAYLRALTHIYADVDFVLRLVNNLLAADVDGDRLVTLFFVRLNPRARTMEFIGAGHRSYLLNAAGEVTALEPQGPPLAVLPNLDFPTSPTRVLQPGEILLLATDGAWEPLGNDGEEYGIPRMLELVRSHRDRPAREIIETLSRDVQQFARRQLDDMTIVVVKVLGAE